MNEKNAQNFDVQKYARIMANLDFLGKRNPDLGRLISAFDFWLEGFVQAGLAAGLSEKSGISGNHSNAGVEKGTVGGVSEIAEESQVWGVPSVSGSTAGSPFGSSASGVFSSVRSSETPTVPAPSESISRGSISSAGFLPSNASSPSLAGSGVGTAGLNVGLNASVNAVGTSTGTVDGLTESPELAVSVYQANNVWRPEDIDQLEKRLLLKIEASRWALERDRLLKNAVDFQAEIEPRDHALLSRARELTNCYLWMNNPETAPVIATDTYEMLADAYHAAAVCVGFMRELIDQIENSPESEILSRILRDALYITATAQSALRRVTQDVSGREDQDQIRIHRWLTLLTKRYGIYVNRHMKKDSLAPKERIYVIPDCIERLRKELTKLGQRQKIQTEGFRRIQYHAGRILNQNGSDYDWNRIIETVDELVDSGIPANNSAFEDSLKQILPHLKSVPSYKEHPFFINVLMELDYWHENAEEKALVKQELMEMPPQPSNLPGNPADEYSSVWDELERSLPGKFPSVSENPAPMRRPGTDSSTREMELNPAPGFGGRFNSAPETAMRRRFVPQPPRSFQESAFESFGSAPEASREPTFANFAQNRKGSQGFGDGILAKEKDEQGFGSSVSPGSLGSKGDFEEFGSENLNAAVSEFGRREVPSYSRYTGLKNIPSYASIVSEKAHAPHHEMPPQPLMEELGAQLRKCLKGKNVIFVDGKAEPRLRKLMQEHFDAVVFAEEAQIASEAKLAQLEHPGNVAIVLMVDGSVPVTNRNVESYCRHFDKPLLRIRREHDVAAILRQVLSAMTLWR